MKRILILSILAFALFQAKAAKASGPAVPEGELYCATQIEWVDYGWVGFGEYWMGRACYWDYAEMSFTPWFPVP